MIFTRDEKFGPFAIKILYSPNLSILCILRIHNISLKDIYNSIKKIYKINLLLNIFSL